MMAVLAVAQPPAILQEGVFNAASHMPPSLPGGGIAPGSRFLIRGLRFAPDSKIELADGSDTLIRSSAAEEIEAVLSPAANRF